MVGAIYCSAVGCLNNTKRHCKEGISFYRFPAKAEQRKLWIKALKRETINKKEWVPGPGKSVIFLHDSHCHLEIN